MNGLQLMVVTVVGIAAGVLTIVLAHEVAAGTSIITGSVTFAGGHAVGKMTPGSAPPGDGPSSGGQP